MTEDSFFSPDAGLCLDERSTDILLNVFLAIAVDNLGDAEEADEEAEKEAEAAAAAAAAAAAGNQGENNVEVSTRGSFWNE